MPSAGWPNNPWDGKLADPYHCSIKILKHVPPSYSLHRMHWQQEDQYRSTGQRKNVQVQRCAQGQLARGASNIFDANCIRWSNINNFTVVVQITRAGPNCTTELNEVPCAPGITIADEKPIPLKWMPKNADSVSRQQLCTGTPKRLTAWTFITIHADDSAKGMGNINVKGNDIQTSLQTGKLHMLIRTIANT